jgi:hypothetical protein
VPELVYPVTLRPGGVKVLARNGVELSPVPTEGAVWPVPVLIVLPGVMVLGAGPITVEVGVPIIAPGAPEADTGAVLTPAPPLVPAAAPEEVPDGVEAAPTAAPGAAVGAVALPLVP